MRRYSYSALIGLSTLGVFQMTGCGSTSMTNVWSDPQAQPALLGKLMVVDIVKNPTERRVFEDRFVVALRARGIQAEPSYRLVSDAQLDSSRAHLEMHKAHCDAVFLTRILDEKTVKTYYPHTTSYTVEKHAVSMETNLYRVQDGALIWSAVSRTWLQSSETLGEETGSIVQELVGALAKTAIVRSTTPDGK